MVAVLLRFCKVPRNDEITLQHFFLQQQRKNFFSITFMLLAIFFFRHALAGIFFSKSTTPSPAPQELNGRPLIAARLGR